MIVTFCGHSEVQDRDSVQDWLKMTAEELVKQGADTFYLGGLHDYDALCASTIRELKKYYPSIKSVLVLPYPEIEVGAAEYDKVICAPQDDTPEQYRFTKRDFWMIEEADVIVTYITHTRSGAYMTYDYAKQKGKKILNYGGAEL